MGVHGHSRISSTSASPVLVDSPADNAPCGVEDAREYLASCALRPSRVGTVGLELERHVVDLAQPSAIVSWQRLRAAIADAHFPAGSRLTMEPGGQIELSTAPAADVAAAIDALHADDVALREVLGAAGLGLHAAGTDPLRPPVRVHPGDRYAAMASYFAAAGHATDAATMMSSTASLQVNVEAGPVAGWAGRVAHIHRLMPALLALSACSPMLRGRHRGVRSERGAMWQRLDPGRCAPFLGHGDPAGAWASFALAAPVMLLRDETTGRCQPVRQRVPLVSWLTGERLLGDRRPTRADLDVHCTTLFPPVRLRGFLELRLLDAVPARWWPGLAAITVAIVDDPRAADRAAAAAEPVARRSAAAVQLGVTDPQIAAAARGLIDAALTAVPSALRGDVEAWAELVESGRTPGDLVQERAERDGPLSCLTAAELC